MCRGQLLVDLDRIAKLERGFLKLFVFQVNFALFNVGYLGFFGIGATADCENCGEENGQKGGVIKLNSALVFHLFPFVVAKLEFLTVQVLRLLCLFTLPDPWRAMPRDGSRESRHYYQKPNRLDSKGFPHFPE